MLHLPAVDDSDVSYMNGYKIGETHASYNSPRHYEIPAATLHEGENLIVIRVEDTGGEGGIWGDAKELYLEVDGKTLPGNGNTDLRSQRRCTVLPAAERIAIPTVSLRCFTTA